MIVATIMDSARNANAVVVGRVVGREQQRQNRFGMGLSDCKSSSRYFERVLQFLCNSQLPGYGEQHMDYPEDVPRRSYRRAIPP